MFFFFKFVAAALNWDAWSRPSPDLPNELRKKEEERKKDTADPNYAAHLPAMMKVGRSEDRPSPTMPSELRLMKYKQGAAVKKLASRDLEKINPALAEELADMALEIEESHEMFEKMAASMKLREDKRPSPDLPNELRAAAKK